MSKPPFKNTSHLRRYILLTVIVLSALAGFVNSVMLTDLIYPVSHVSGSLTHLSLDGATGQVKELGQLLGILVGFFAGAVVGGIILGGTETETGRRYGGALLLEAFLLAVAPLLVQAGHAQLAMIFPALACGLQNAMFSNYRGLVLRTTHFTGSLTDLGVLIGRSSHKHGDLWFASVLFLSILAFLGGGFAGAVHAAQHQKLASLFWPALVCLLLGLGYSSYHQFRRRRDGEEDGADQDCAAMAS